MSSGHETIGDIVSGLGAQAASQASITVRSNLAPEITLRPGIGAGRVGEGTSEADSPASQGLLASLLLSVAQPEVALQLRPDAPPVVYAPRGRPKRYGWVLAAAALVAGVLTLVALARRF